MQRIRVSISAGTILLASFAASAAAEGVGVTSAVNQSAQGQLGGGKLHTIRLGQSVFYNEQIRTSSSGLLQILLVDGSTFTVGPDSNLIIDSFVYDPAAESGEMVATFSKGVARFVGGRLSKNKGGVTINTRQGTVGIRGGIATLLEQGGQSVYSFVYGKDLVFSGRAGGSERIYRPGFSVFASGGKGKVGRTPQGLYRQIVASLSGKRGNNGGSASEPGANQLQTFGQINSALAPRYRSPIPAPVLKGNPQEPLDRKLDIPDANADYIRGPGHSSRYCYPPSNC
ncbi:FecR domain-containing protein [Rhizobiales bacterium]|uniref:FecR family protein n=1 Tax=Hongsoonwoonella zoysiae TaxID=2821844 RepID=UPI001560480C|nr:FecR domain-containing protein [Hongsoonwoonella zoysiae]NRG19542.1 FecR domain-containing protein [Hongsoonwoonella zoysiae]